MFIGAIGPWATAFGVLSVAGTDGDGFIVLIAALIIGAMVFLRHVKRFGMWTLAVAMLAAVVAVATSLYDLATIQHTISDSDGLVSIGWGLWLDCLASISVIGALVFLWRAKSSVSEFAAFQPPASPE
jgi:uncharacterized membrane protein